MIVQFDGYEVNYSDIYSISEKLPEIDQPILIYYRNKENNIQCTKGWYSGLTFYNSIYGTVEALYWSELPILRIT